MSEFAIRGEIPKPVPVYPIEAWVKITAQMTEDEFYAWHVYLVMKQFGTFQYPLPPPPIKTNKPHWRYRVEHGGLSDG